MQQLFDNYVKHEFYFDCWDFLFANFVLTVEIFLFTNVFENSANAIFISFEKIKNKVE